MGRLRIEKEYGERTISESSDGYAKIAVPPGALEEERFGFNLGDRVDVVGVIEGDEAYVKLEVSE